jgi:hypothetical protein
MGMNDISCPILPCIAYAEHGEIMCHNCPSSGEEPPSMNRPEKIPFHENGKTYYWHIPSRTVTDEAGGEVATNCFNLQIARTKVKIKKAGSHG